MLNGSELSKDRWQDEFFPFPAFNFFHLVDVVYFGCRCHYHRRRLHSQFSTQRCPISNTSLEALHFDARRHRLPSKSIWHFDVVHWDISIFREFLSFPLFLLSFRSSLRRCAFSFNKIHWYLWHNVICFNQCAAIRLSFVPINLVCLRSISCFHSLIFPVPFLFRSLSLPSLFHCLID